MGTAETLLIPEPSSDSPALLDRTACNIVLLGPSGAGKTAVAEGLYELGIADVNATVATRPLRETESAAATLDHVFTSPAAFANRKDEGEFVVTRTYYGFDYGAPRLRRPPAGRVALIVLKASFMEEFAAYYPNTCVYQIETSPAIAYERMLRRGHQSNADIVERMKCYGPELDAGRLIARRLFNNDRPLATTVRQVAARIARDVPTLSADSV